MMTRSLLSLLGSATILLGTTPLIQAQDSGVSDNAADPSAKDILARALERAAVCHTQSVHPPEQLCVDSRWCLDGHGRTRTAFVCAAAAPDSSVHRQKDSATIPGERITVFPVTAHECGPQSTQFVETLSATDHRSET